MFLRYTTRKKNGKEHRYYSLVENRRLAGGRVVQRHALHLGEINDSQQDAWRKTIEIFEEGQAGPRTVALFPEERIGPAADGDIVRIRLSQLSLHRPRQWGACWLAGQLWEQLGLDRFWADRLPPSRKGTRWDWVLQILTTYRCWIPAANGGCIGPGLSTARWPICLGRTWNWPTFTSSTSVTSGCWRTKVLCSRICTSAGRTCSMPVSRCCSTI